MNNYRALISVPIRAKDSGDAFEIAVEYAHSLMHPGSKVIAGHVELVVKTDRVGLAAFIRESREYLAGRFREWIHSSSLSQCGPGVDECPDWPLAYELADIAIPLVQMLDPLAQRGEEDQ